MNAFSWTAEQLESFAAWLDQCVVVDAAARASEGGLYTAWCAFAAETQRAAGSPEVFRALLEQSGFRAMRFGAFYGANCAGGYVGLCLKDGDAFWGFRTEAQAAA